MKVAIFCSANDRIDADYFRQTELLGQWLARQGYDVVFGGCNMGLMQCVAKAARSAGGHTIGVVPSIIEEHGGVSDEVDVDIPCDDLSERKALMLAQSDVSIALPGGLGTLDEIFSVVASHTIGYHCQCVILYNMKGFWNPLIDLLDDMTAKGMIRGDYHRQIKIAESLDDIAELLK